jgi:small-conductance mechanosensitive channel
MLVFVVAAGVLSASASTTFAQDENRGAPVEIEQQSPHTDQQIARRIDEIFAQIESLKNVTVTVDAGVVILKGTTNDADAVEEAAALANRVTGVVTVQNEIRRDASVEKRLTSTLDQTRQLGEDAIRFMPLIGIAIAIFLCLVLVGRSLARWSWFWARIAPNSFIAGLLQRTTRLAFVALGIIAALALLDATAFLSAFLGAAGVLGLAVGFAVRDTIENYISSIMLSIRQPFRPNDHVVIDGREGRVVRLTSRATILMTMAGNHLRIPNAAVFKAVILNYSRNPLRRFEFELGVDADDDPLAAIETGLATLNKLDFLVPDPQPLSFIHQVGDSNIVLFFAGWIDQQETSFPKARSTALAAVKSALEAAGFALPEPIYRLRFDADAPAALREITEIKSAASPPSKRTTVPEQLEKVDLRPERDIEGQVNEERRQKESTDLLNENAPEE